MTVGERIRQIRESKGISQEELAKILGLKDKSSVCKIEKAGDDISTKSIKKYATALGVSVAELMGWKDSDPSVNPDLVVEAVGLYEQIQNLPKDKQAALYNYLQFLKSGS